MRNSIIITLIVIAINVQNTSAQYNIILRDSISNEVIPFAHVLSKQGELISLTDQNGFCQLQNNHSDLTLKIQHISYKSYIFSHLKPGKDTIILKMGPLELQSIQVIGKPLNDNDYLVAKGYFRSYQLNDGVPKYFSDGIIEYYFPIKTKNKRLAKINVLEHRTFKNEKLLASDKQRGFNVSMESFGPPFLYKTPTIKNIEKDYQLSQINGQETIYDHNLKIGSIAFDSVSKTAALNVDIDYREREIVHKAFGYESRYDQEVFSEVYNPTSSDYHQNSYENIQRVKQYRKLHFKQKSQKNFEVIEWVHEFYTLEKQYLSKDEFKEHELKEYSKVKYSSEYSTDFESKIAEMDIPELPESISKSLTTILSISKN